MDNQTITRSVPRSVGLLGTLIAVGLAVVGIWGFVDGYTLDASSEYVAPTIAVLAVTVVVVGGLAVLGARSKRWLEGPYW